MSPIKLLCACGALVDHKPCPNCQHQDNQRRNRKSRAHGLHTPQWKRLRRARLELDNYRCTLTTDNHCTHIATTVHLHPRLKGNHLAATLDDLQSACAHCHGVTDGGRATPGFFR